VSKKKNEQVNGMENVINFEEASRRQKLLFRKKAEQTMDINDLQNELDYWLSPIAAHLTQLQAFLVNEAMTRGVTDAFAHGLKYAKYCRRELRDPSSSTEQIYDKRYALEMDGLIRDICHQYRLFYYLNDWDLYSLQLVMEQLVKQWFVKGLTHNLKTRPI
jgi:hypothetical protein